jgi:glutamate synthase domain-containing protein 1
MTLALIMFNINSNYEKIYNWLNVREKSVKSAEDSEVLNMLERDFLLYNDELTNLLKIDLSV